MINTLAMACCWTSGERNPLSAYENTETVDSVPAASVAVRHHGGMMSARRLPIAAPTSRVVTPSPKTGTARIVATNMPFVTSAEVAATA